MAEENYMDDKLYEAARSCEGIQIPAPPDDDELYYLRVTPGDGNTALHVAAQHGNHKFIEAFLSRVDPAAGRQILCKRNSVGETPLHLGAESGSKRTVEVILKAHDVVINDDDNKIGSGCCWREKDKRQGDTPLHLGLKFRHEKIAVSMLERDLEYLVTLNNDAGESLAYVAAQNYCPFFLTKILEADRDGLCCISFTGPLGQTVFHPARRLSREIVSISIEARKYLLKAQDIKGKTVLHYAVEEERGPIVEILLKADNTIAVLHDNDGMTPLHIAASKGFLLIIEMILKLSPQSIATRDKLRGQTALHTVKMDGYSLEKCLKNTRMKELINKVDNDGNTPLHLALMNSDLATADKLLLVDDINWRLTNKLGYSPVDLCISNDQIPLKLRHLEEERRVKEVLKMDVFFHKKVINVDDVLEHYNWEECLAFKGPHGENIFHIAARDGNSKIVNRVHESDSACSLLLSGKNSRGETPLHLAAKHGRLMIVKSILSITRLRNNENPSTVVAIQNGTELMNYNPIGDHVKPWRMKSINGDTPAHKAIRNRHFKVALLLLEHDPELVFVNNDANESLLYLAADNNCYHVIEAILSEGRKHYNDSITSGRCGQNVFHAAARCQNVGFFRKSYTRLIENQPHLLRKVDDDGKTPLHYAIEEWRVIATKWILQQDKSTAFVYDNEGFTPLLKAAVLGSSVCLRRILTLCPQSAKLPDLRSNKTVLHLAKMPLLLLHFCLQHDVMKKLVNETDNDGNTALHCAILDGDTDKAVKLLETPGINWKIRNNQQKSPMDLCRQQVHAGETKQVLLDYY